METIAVAAIGVLSAAFAGAGLWTFLVARRTKSGRVATTEAERLWAEASSIRKDQADENRLLRTELVEARKEITALVNKMTAVEIELVTTKNSLTKALEDLGKCQAILEAKEAAKS